MANRRRASSRVIKREKQKLMRQTMLFGGIAIVIIVVFIFLILPGFIGVINSFLNTNPFEPEDTIPPQPPVISIPAEATTSASITISGFGEAGSELTLLFNGVKERTTTIEDDGTFSADLMLEEGENILEAYATDAAGNESAKSKSHVVILDTTDPSIELEQPSEGQEIIGRENENYQIKGETEPRAELYINDRSVFINADGTFSYTYRLEEGENSIRFRAVDQAGNETETEISVRFRY